MKKYALSILSVALLMVSATGVKAKEGNAAVSNLKFGVVDLQRALNEIEEGKKAKEKLKAEFEAKQKKLELQRGEIEKLQADYQKQRLVASEESLKTKGEELAQKMRSMQMELNNAQQQLSTQEMQVTQQLLEKIKVIVADIGKKENFTAIFEKSQNVLLFSQDATDLTTRVVTDYNKKK